MVATSGQRPIGARAGGARDGQLAVFQGLARDLEHLGLEPGQLVEEEDAVVGQAHLARSRDGAAADKAGLGDGVGESGRDGW
jgi:hypothetical protein